MFIKLLQIINIVDCEWDDWKLGECDKSCGVRTITREVKVEAQHGGDECKGLSSATVPCNAEECPGNIEGELEKFLLRIHVSNLYDCFAVFTNY